MHEARSRSHRGAVPVKPPGPPRPTVPSAVRAHCGRAIGGLTLVWVLTACGTAQASRPTPTATSATVAPAPTRAAGTVATPGTPATVATTGVPATTATTATTATSTAGPTAATVPTATAGTSRGPTIDARAYAIYDEDAGRLLASSDADDRLPVGSLMKLLNAVVAYRAGDPEQAVVAPDGLRGESDESVIGIRAGQTITRGVLIRAMLKVSANDAARLLALDIAGSEERYAEMMNDAAADLSLTNTHAANASGLDADGQFSSANDLVTLGSTLLRDPTFRQTVGEPTAVLNGKTFPNTNDLLRTYAGADGIKTGHTSGAGWCILASATRDGRRIVVAVLGTPSEAARDEAAATLLVWAFGQR